MTCSLKNELINILIPWPIWCIWLLTG